MHNDKYNPVPHNHEKILADLLKNPEFKKEYKALDERDKMAKKSQDYLLIAMILF